LVNVGAKHSLYRGAAKVSPCLDAVPIGAMSSRRTAQTCRTDDR
jgi:hypothetical protein